MGRTITEVHTELKENFVANTAIQSIYNLDNSQSFDKQFSKVSIENQFLYVVAVSISVLENLFSTHKNNVDNKLALQRRGTRSWLVEIAKQFQYGYALESEKDYYKILDKDAQIIKHASIDEINGKLYMKVATLANDQLCKLNSTQFAAFAEYIKKIKYAGVNIEIITDDGDDLRIVADIYYDPLVLNEKGELLSNSSIRPAEDTLTSFITSLPFNGEFIPAKLVDAWQATEGIDIPEILNVETKYAANDWQVIKGKVVPNAGYMNIKTENLTLNYIANVRG